MKSLLPVAVVIALGSSGAALAGDDCRRPMAEWQSRDAVNAHVAALGITPERLRIDDGCYEVRGRDGEGNRIELTVELLGEDGVVRQPRGPHGPEFVEQVWDLYRMQS